METGADVWLRDKVGKSAWLPAIIQSKVRGDQDGISVITVRSMSGEELTFNINDSSDNDHDDVKLRNAFEDADTEDLINLPYLHEPAILCCLEQRYGNSNIYTYTGPILIAVNPFKKVNLYSTQILESYYNIGLLKSQGIESSGKLPPHVYAVADAAFRSMMNGIHNSNISNNQSILISGESGAGTIHYVLHFK
jgi:myosin heavy subunit